MKKIIFTSLLVATSVFAFDISSTAKNVGGAMGVTPDSIGNKLADMIKDKAPKTYEQAQGYCQQASTYKSFVGIKEGMLNKAIEICAKSSVKEATTEKTTEKKDSTK